MILLVAGVLGLGLLAYRKFFPGDETLIRRVLDEVAVTASVSFDEKPLTRLTKAARLASHFAPNLVLKIAASGLDDRTVEGQEELTQLIVSARSALSEMKVEFFDSQVEVVEGTATVHTTAFARASGQGDPIAQVVKMVFTKADGAWKIQRVETVRDLRR